MRFSRQAFSFCPRRVSLSILLLVFQWEAVAQGLEIRDAVRTYETLINTAVTMSGRAELRITGTGDPIAGSVIHLDSPDAWLLMTEIPPSQLVASFLSRVRVGGAPAVRGSNVRVVQYVQGAVVIPQFSGFSPLEVFDERYFAGGSARLDAAVEYDVAALGEMAAGIRSFKLKRGYTATFAVEADGTGVSYNYVAQDGDLEVGYLPADLEDKVRFVRIYEWRWVGKKGIAGNIESGLDVDWTYNWNIDRNSQLDWEYVPIRQTQFWPTLDQDWRARGASHLLGFNEPDRPDQANMSVATAINNWPSVQRSGLRLGAPVVSDGGLSWLYDFMGQADAGDLRVDFVPVHYYRCHGNVGDPQGTATQFYNFLKGVHDQVQRPLWVTEWNNGAGWTTCGDPTFAQQEAAVAAMIQMLDDTPFVERYALYNWVEDVRRVKWDDGSLTAAGNAYRDQKSPLAYRQQLANRGTGSSARYAFDGDAHDGGYNGETAMLVGAPSYTAGKHGQAIVLDGEADYLQASPRLGGSADWSFAGWVYWDGGANWQRVFDFGESVNSMMFLTPKSGNNTLRFGIAVDGVQQQLNAPALPVGEWTHVAVTLAGDTGKLFVNGVRVAMNTAMTHNPNAIGGSAVKYNFFGKSRFSADPLFSGRLDDLRFQSSALADNEVVAIFSTEPPRFITNPVRVVDARADQPYSASLVGEVSGAGALTFAKMSGPGWLTVGANGTLSGTPGIVDGGLNRFLVRVVDSVGSVGTAMMEIHVPNTTTTISSGADDAEQAVDGSVDFGSTDLELVRDAATGSGDQIIGLRFSGLDLPQGSVIHEARVQFTADETQSEATVLNLYAELADDAAAFVESSNDLGSRTRTSLSVPWQPNAWTAGQSGVDQLTPNIAGLVQEVVTRPGWEAGNALVVLIDGSGHRTAESFNGSAESAPRLSISYTTPPPLHRQLVAISSGDDDVEQAADGEMNLNSTDLELVDDLSGGSLGQVIGLRFGGIALPAGAIVERAEIQFAADEANSEATALTIRAEAAANAPGFVGTASNLTARVLTSARVGWTPAPWLHVSERGELQRTPDFSEVLREVIGIPGWSSGNAIAIMIEGSGHRTADSADKLGGAPATLEIQYRREGWAGTFGYWSGGIAAEVDIDGDGYNHLAEYALGLDPNVPDQAVTIVEGDGDFMYLSYTRAAGVTDVSYTVEWSDDLRDWSRVGVIEQIIADDGTRRSVRAAIPRGGAERRFGRVKIGL